MSGYPRKERCLGCGLVDVDVVSPADTWVLCHLCLLALNDEAGPVSLSEMLRDEEAYYVAMLNDPDISDDAIADTVLALRRARGEQPLGVTV